jgi:hypothetical protein
MRGWIIGDMVGAECVALYHTENRPSLTYAEAVSGFGAVAGVSAQWIRISQWNVTEVVACCSYVLPSSSAKPISRVA